MRSPQFERRRALDRGADACELKSDISDSVYLSKTIPPRWEQVNSVRSTGCTVEPESCKQRVCEIVETPERGCPNEHAVRKVFCRFPARTR